MDPRPFSTYRLRAVLEDAKEVVFWVFSLIDDAT
jgi:hypothetical protein